jgi:hypothetical protein
MSRYSGLVFPQLRPFASILFLEIAGLKRNVVKVLSDDAKNAIVVWRSFLCLFVLYPINFTRPLYHLTPKVAVVALEFDASLRGLGIRLFKYLNDVKVECFCITYSFNECLFDEEVQFELGGRNEKVGGSYSEEFKKGKYLHILHTLHTIYIHITYIT